MFKGTAPGASLNCVGLVEGSGGDWRGTGEAGQFLLSNLLLSDICHLVQYLPCPHHHLWGQGGGISSDPTLGPIGGAANSIHVLIYTEIIAVVR